MGKQGKYATLHDGDSDSSKKLSVKSIKKQLTGGDNKHFLEDYEPYVIREWAEGYFAYDSLKGIYKKLKKSVIEKADQETSKADSLASFDRELLDDIKKVYAFLKVVAVKVNEDLTMLEEEMRASSTATSKSVNDTQLNRNYELSLRLLYVKIQHLEEFYNLNYYCIVKTAKKFNKLLMHYYADKQHAKEQHHSSGDSDGTVAHDEAVDGGSDEEGESTRHKIRASAKRFLRVWNQSSLASPMDMLERSLFSHVMQHNDRNPTSRTTSALFAANPDHLWKDTNSGSFFYLKFIDKLNIIHHLKEKCVGIYSAHFRKSYGELAEFELRYVKNKEHYTADTKFILGLKYGGIVCMVRSHLLCVSATYIILCVGYWCSW
jgi:hypothetical protein